MVSLRLRFHILVLHQPASILGRGRLCYLAHAVLGSRFVVLVVRVMFGPPCFPPRSCVCVCLDACFVVFVDGVATRVSTFGVPFMVCSQPFSCCAVAAAAAAAFCCVHVWTLGCPTGVFGVVYGGGLLVSILCKPGRLVIS